MPHDNWALPTLPLLPTFWEGEMQGGLIRRGTLQGTGKTKMAKMPRDWENPIIIQASLQAPLSGKVLAEKALPKGQPVS